MTPAEPYLIRLRGPWELTPLERWTCAADGTRLPIAEPLPRGGRLELPADWSALLGNNFHGRVRHLRRFGRPTGLDSRQQVWLAFTGLADAASVRLNQELLGHIASTDLPDRFEITGRLLPRNELIVDVEFPASQSTATPGDCGGLTGEVRLEIVEAGS